MSALVTQTLDEKLKILFIARPTKLAELVAKNIQSLNKIDVILSSLEDLQKKQNLLQENWYKICLLLEHPFEESFLSSLSPILLNKCICIMPLTSAVNKRDSGASNGGEVGGDVALNSGHLGWKKQVFSEKSLFDILIKNIDISRFIFYKDLIKKNLNPVSFLFSQLNQQMWLDPRVELRLQSAEVLAQQLSILLLRPHRKARVIEGKLRLSGVYVQKIRDIHSKHHLVKLPIKQISLNPTQHPILKIIGLDLGTEPTFESSDEIVNTMVRFCKFSKNKMRKGKNIKTPISRPKKIELVKIWNRIEKAKQNMGSIGDKSQVKTGAAQLKINPPLVEKIFRSEIDESQAVNTLFSSYRSYQKKDHLDQMTKKTKLGFRKLKNHKLLFFGGIGVSLMASVMLTIMIVFFINISRIQSQFLAYLNSRSLPITAQEKKITELKQSADLITNQLGFVNPFFPMKIFSQAKQIAEVSQLLGKLTEQMLQFQQAKVLSYQEVSNQVDGDSFITLKKTNQWAQQVFKTISLLRGELKNYSTEKLSSEEKQLIEEYQQYLTTQEKSLGQHQQLSALFPTLLGQEQRQVYALILQNNQELRPTGGFIQAVALLTFDRGKLINIQVEDVYSLDQQLKGVVEPPMGVKQFLGEERWFLRDSNWSPDFPEVAERIRWFIDKSLGVNVDGVIGINIKVLEEILTVVEQLNLDEHNEILTKRNLGERMEFHSEVKLVDTSVNRDYGELVLFKLLNKLKVLPSEKIIPLLTSLTKMADSKELLIAVFQPGLQSSFESLGWSGSLIAPDCPSVFGKTHCVVDMIAQVEANVGVNKANYYLDRQIDHSITLLPNQVIHKRVISFKNKAQTNAWPKGSYKAYTRFYLPLNVEIKSIKINDLELVDEQIIKSVELERQVVGVLTETAVKTETKLQLEYSLPYQEQTPFTYVFFDQKQPGARETSPRVFLQHAPDLSPTLIAPQAEVEGDVIVFNPSKDIGHMFVGATFE